MTLQVIQHRNDVDVVVRQALDLDARGAVLKPSGAIGLAPQADEQKPVQRRQLRQPLVLEELGLDPPRPSHDVRSETPPSLPLILHPPLALRAEVGVLASLHDLHEGVDICQSPMLTTGSMPKQIVKTFPRRRRMVSLPKRIDDALLKRARQLGQGLSPIIRSYVVDGLKRDNMLDFTR